MRDCDIELVGFVVHPEIADSGASPDGFVGAEGMVEFKCPLTATHLDTLLGHGIDPDYITQVQWQMACRPERKWCDWVSFDPRLPATMQLCIHRVPRDAAKIEQLEKEVRDFLAELDAKVAELRARYETKAAA